ncbi:DcrB-related protein [Sphingomonas montana]|uniref:DcrB-related protein n=1 Tax=Sphingomonas montana TaxID=1843236 RepID=UPI0009F8EC8D|nr:DcrB-related protein [Sphingomonas montana]
MSDETLYAINEGTLPLDVPGTWEDQTIHVLRVPGAGRATASLVITRETLPVGMEVGDYMRAETGRLQATLPEFTLHGRVPVAWPDVTGEALLTRWRSTEGTMDQILTCRRANGRRLLIFTATHPTPFPTPVYDVVMAAIAGFVPRESGSTGQIGGGG